MNSRALLVKLVFSFLVFLFGGISVLEAQVQQAPYFEDFEAAPWVPYHAYSTNLANTTSAFGANWSRSAGDSLDYRWQVLYGRERPFLATGPKGGHPNYIGNFLAARRLTNSVGPDTITFTTPQVDLSTLVDPYFSFHYHRHGNNLPKLTVEVNDGSGWQTIFNSDFRTHFSVSDPYLYSGHSLSAFGNIVEVRFSAISTNCCPGTVAIDDISFVEKLNCHQVENVNAVLATDTSVALSWQAVPGALSYIVYKNDKALGQFYGHNSFIVDTVTSLSLLIDTLRINSCYQFFVRAFCAPNDTGWVSQSVKVCTPELRTYSMPFHNALNGWPIGHWNVSASNGFYLQNLGGVNYLQAAPHSSWLSDSAKLISPFIYLDSKARVRFLWSRYAGTNMNDTMKVYIREIGQVAWSQILVKTGLNFSDSTSVLGLPGDYVEEIIPLDSATYTGKMVEVAIAYSVESLASQRLYVKDFIVEKPFTTDLGIVSAKFIKNTPCVTGNDSISLMIFNNSDSLFNAQKSPLTVSIKIRGLKDSIQTRIINSGIIPSNSNGELWFEGINFPRDDVYTIIEVNLHRSNYNNSSINDYLKDGSESINLTKNLSIQPDSLVILTNTADSAIFKANSNFFKGGEFIFSEICHYKTTVGEPQLGWPTYLASDEYFEITGYSSADLNGYTVEIWTDTQKDLTYTFNTSTPLSINGTATIGFTNNQNSNPTFKYYEIGPSSGSYIVFSFHSRGYILKNPFGVIVDAVGYSDTITPYVFPSAANVSPLQWSGHIFSVAGSAGIRLEGSDLNNGTNWITADLSPQNPNSKNANLVFTGAIEDSSFFWSNQGDTLSTDSRLIVGPYQQNGFYNYVAHFTNYCGIFSDTAWVFVNSPSIHCAAPTGLNVKDVSCTRVDINWSKNGGDSAVVEIGLPNFFPGLNQMNQLIGTTLDSLRINQLEAGKTYEIWTRNFCGLDTSAWEGPISFTTPTGPAPTADFTITQIMTGTSVDLKVDAANSIDAESYTWIYGNSTNGSGLLDSLSILNNGSFDITLIVENACGTDSLTKTIFVNIGIDENEATTIQRIEVYPNPAKDVLTIDIINLGEQKMLTAHVYDPQGKELIRRKIPVDKAFTQTKLDLAPYSSGLYLLIIEGDNKSWKKKVVVD